MSLVDAFIHMVRIVLCWNVKADSYACLLWLLTLFSVLSLYNAI